MADAESDRLGESPWGDDFDSASTIVVGSTPSFAGCLSPLSRALLPVPKRKRRRRAPGPRPAMPGHQARARGPRSVGTGQRQRSGKTAEQSHRMPPDGGFGATGHKTEIWAALVTNEPGRLGQISEVEMMGPQPRYDACLVGVLRRCFSGASLEAQLGHRKDE